ncbi:MAG: ATP-dependent DNA helicase RecQ [Bacteroidota bacterium]
MSTSHEILNKYWGFSSFRPLQEEIINSVLQGKDCLALLPTGGGKSICFQVPALMMDGICIVVSPLIALMKDQVENLTSRGIKAISINSSMHRQEIDIALDNCVHGNIKFLYLSPERLETEIVKARLPKMKVNLIAIDESHCISQWGYDFRPSYLKLSELRELLPSVPFLALTATATKEVVIDIQKKLLFKKQNVFQKSYERTNIAYAVLNVDDKLARLLKIANNIHGSGIVYVRNRKKTKDIANYLISHQISADYYHAGLDAKTRDQKQNDWINNNIRVIVCTNAFGMGIDKPDVRFVVHIDVPDSIEAYFQEAGRAGRDERKAYAVMLFNATDKLELLRNVELSFPEIEEIKKTYQALANYYQIATGAGMGVTFDFDISSFCYAYKLQAITTFNCLKFIEREGFITLSDSFFQPARFKMSMNREDLYKFQITNESYDVFIKLLLRSYSGIFDNFVKINEYDLARKANISLDNLIKRLSFLHQQNVITYFPHSELPQLTFIHERIDAKEISISKENYALLKKRAKERMETVINYVESTHKCRSQLLLSYFGENKVSRCFHCDVCLVEKRKILHTDEYERTSLQIKQLLSLHPLDLKTLVDSITDIHEDKTLHTIQLMYDNKLLFTNEDNKVCLNE